MLTRSNSTRMGLIALTSFYGLQGIATAFSGLGANLPQMSGEAVLLADDFNLNSIYTSKWTDGQQLVQRPD